MGRKRSADHTLADTDVMEEAKEDALPVDDSEPEDEGTDSCSTCSDSEASDEEEEEEEEEKEKEEEGASDVPVGFNGGVRRVSLPFCRKERKDSLQETRIPIVEDVQKVKRGVVGRMCKDWVILWPLGKGNGGSVYLGSHVNTGEKVAIKIISKRADKNKQVTHKRIKRALKEASIMKRLAGHKQIVQLQELFEDDENIFLIMQYAEGGDLFEHIRRRGKLTTIEALDIFHQVVRAMAIVHSKGITHRDLKPENVFLDRKGKVLIGDWGLACRWSSYKKNKASCGSINYAASEIVCRRPYTGPEVDMFSMGAILYTMLTGRLPFGAPGSQETLRRSARGQFFVDPCLSPEERVLFERVFQPDPFKRGTIYDTLSWSTDYRRKLRAVTQTQSPDHSSDESEGETSANSNSGSEVEEADSPPVPFLVPGLAQRRRCVVVN